ncbi:hypothetical protein [Paenibacillus wulumuqiensis]|uniref:hypothetical protein n=1 Tax=Paenibacillus wulumuqiensis TaxID=1567107 RepID=UPI001F2EB763|nr:hypothetical protein [Paenibacillus wulumuqiensis]
MMYQRTAAEHGCKGCNRSPQLSEEKIQRLITIALQGKAPEELAAEEIQQQRFETCMSCPSLQYGTTCKHCGCLVHIRTRLAASSCPSPYGSQWQSEACKEV